MKKHYQAILKSDYANGYFGFLGACTPERAVTEATNTTCFVDRRRGDDGNVNITWGVFQITDNGPVQAIDDFVNSRGIITFAAKEKTKTFVVQVKDDTIPEVMETFEIRLVSVSTVGGSGTTNISGASIDPLRATSSFVIDGNDFPNGLLQFNTSSNPPTLSDVPLPVAISQPQVCIGDITTVLIKKSEESGVVSLLVVRAQGTTGIVSVEWKTVDGTAKSAGKVPLDYAAGAGKLTFQNGQLYSYINIAIIDNQIPEGEKTFTVELLNPTGGATTGIGSKIDVVIDSSDGAYGVFQFEDSSLNVVAQELGDSGYNSVFLNVLRLQGDIGVIGVTWKILGNPGNDIVEVNGTVVFPHGVTRASIEIKIRGDTEPELNEVYQIQLTGTQQNVSLNVTLTVQRLYGKHGTVVVSYRTLSPTETYPYMPASVLRASTADFKPVTGAVQFQTDETIKEFTIQIYDDFEPENDESVFIQLTNVTVLSQPLNASVSAIIGPASQSYAQVIIRSNDNANGALELSPLSTSVSESSGSAGIGVNVIRKGGSFGQVSVRFQVINGTAFENLDFVVLSNRVILLDGETSKPVSVQIIDDQIPELTEVFYIKLLDQIEGGAVLGSSIDTVVKIEFSDDPVGAFGGTMGVVSLYWEAKLNGGFPVADISPTSGYVHFVSNDASKNILVAVLPDNTPEGQEDITFRLVNASNGGRLGNRKEFRLTIPPNDNPHGVIVLSNSNFTVEEKDTNDVQYISLTRIGGLYGQLRVYFSTVQIDIIQEASQGGNTVLSYFNAPSGGSRGVTGNSIDVSTVSNPAELTVSGNTFNIVT
ncbi:hypothetical protein KUTeg_017727 [Tegillarca granosa]|uniref:Calx-beta domain-containing protein n=1 Tax=Tegillarca granosa TaxID=220873 RepID=A0ABQ9EFR7_TEGGR|nr:hypothetical protein KUTeg_017727 [Tegillarca granosa]